MEYSLINENTELKNTLNESFKTIETLSDIVKCQTDIITTICSNSNKESHSELPDWIVHMFD